MRLLLVDVQTASIFKARLNTQDGVELTILAILEQFKPNHLCKFRKFVLIVSY